MAAGHWRRSASVLIACAALYAGSADAQRTGDPKVSTASPLIDAVRKSDRAAVRQLLQKKADVNAASADGTTALIWAAQLNDLESAKLLLGAGANVRSANRYGVTPLQAAAINGDPALITALLKAGADPNAILPEGETVLMTAARTGRVEALTALIEGGARLDGQEKWFGETPLIWAAAEDHAAAVELLVRRGADVNGPSAKQNYRSRRAGQSVLALGSWTPVMYAARQGAHDSLRALIEAGADLNLVDPDGATALVIAIINANYDEATLLVEKGADPNIGDKEARMAALYAAVDMHRLAIGHGRPNTKPSGQLDAVDLIKVLLAKGANPNARLSAPLMQRHHTGGDRALGDGSTPFMRAAKSGDVAVMRLLLAAGADPLLKQPNQTTALMLAAGLGWRDGSPAAPSYDQGSEQDAIEAIKLCMQAGIDINAATNTGETALHAAITGRSAESIVRFLVESGANLNAKNKQGRTPLDVAVASRRELGGIVSFLKQKMNPPSP